MSMTLEEAHAMAVRRITHARETGAEILDLGDRAALSDGSPVATLAHLTNLNLFIMALSDVSPLATLANLTNLSLGVCPALSDVSPLATLANLTTLHLSYCGVLSDVSPLA